MLVLRAALLAAALAVAGCAAVSPVGGDPGAGRSPADDRGVRDCLALFEELDRLALTTDTRDGAAYRVPGFPYLRTDRFTASFAADAVGDDAQWPAWVERMRQLDAAARAAEIANLPDTAFPVLHGLARDALPASVETCGRRLAAATFDRPRLAAAAIVPDDYVTALRALGLYPVSGIGIAAGIRRWEADARAAFAAQRHSPQSGVVTFQRYQPPAPPASAEAALATARAALAESPRDPLGVPQISAEALERLFTAYAPIFAIATQSDSDRFGVLRWIDLQGLLAPGSDPLWLDVDTAVPAVYRRLAFTRFGRAVLPQLIYSIWFSEHPAQDISDLHAGRLDGLVWRVTLDEQGMPLIYDSIQTSGRYAQFFPTARLRPLPPPADDPLAEWAFSPIDQPIERWVDARQLAGVTLFIASSTHRLVGVGRPDAVWGEPVVENPSYRQIDDDSLRSLPLPLGGHRGIFDAAGLVPGTERLGRWVLWASGIQSLGSMRQWGRQPTALVGRRHFDDADLLSKRYERLR